MASRSTEQDVYGTAGFGATLKPGRRPVVVVVDLMRSFTEADFRTGADLSSVVQQTNRVLESGRAAGTPVIFTTISYSEAEVASDVVAWLRKSTGMRDLREGTEAVALDPRLSRESHDIVMVKKGASAFFGTSLTGMLASLGCDTVIVCGASTSGCVRATAVDAVQTGYTVVVPRECVGDRADGPHDANLFDIQEKYGEVVATEEVAQYLKGLKCPEQRSAGG